MPAIRSSTKVYRRAIRPVVRQTLEALELRLLFSGNSYTVSAYSFIGDADGSGPFSGLIADTQGNFFGTAVSGGTDGVGTVFALPAGKSGVVTFHSFTSTPDGATPYGGLALDSSGNLFGTTFGGGANGDGSVFEIPAGSADPIVLYSFSGLDGANPYAGLVLDSAGDIFGTTISGGLLNHGTVFEIPSGSNLTTLHSFHGVSDGATPYSQLMLDGSGNLYGTTYAGGSGGNGTVFEISGGVFTTLHAFAGVPDGSKPTGQLVVDGDGNIFGTTSAGGVDNHGTVFKIDTSSTLTTLYSFTGGADGASPFAGLVFDGAGDLFGTTYLGGAHGKGTVFEIPADGTVPEPLYAFTGGADGTSPYGPILINAQGDLFGTTTGGGANGDGTLFELSPTLSTQLTVVQQPSDVEAGATMNPFIVLNLKLTNGNINVADNSNITLSITSGPTGGTLGGTTTVQAHNGVASFSNLNLTHAGTYTLVATDGTLNPVTLDSFVVNAGPAARLAFGQQPTGFTAGQTMSPATTVFIEDKLGNVTTDNSMVTLKLISGPVGADLTGMLTVQATDGVATFDDLSLAKVGSYKVSAADGNLSAVKSGAFIVTPDVASSQLVITQQPGNTIVGKKISPAVTVAVEDQFGNLITSNTGQVSASLIVLNLGGNATGAALTGIATVNLVKGTAIFGNLAISQPGNYELQLASDGFTSVTTDPILSFFVPTHLVFTQQPAQTIAGTTFGPAVTVSIEDSIHRIDTTNNSMVTISLKGNGTLNGTLSVAAINGVATFTDLSVNQAGTYKLSVASGSLTSAKSTSFHVVPDLSTSHLVAGRLPVTPSVVGKTLAPKLILYVEDQFGNLIKSDHSTAAISIAAGPAGGTLSGNSTVNASGGVVTFKNLFLPLAGVYSLQIDDASLAINTPVLVDQTITQGVTSVSGLPATSNHIFGQTITLSANFKSTAPTTIPFTGVATLTDNNDNVLGAVSLTASGLAKFNLTGLTSGTYLCAVSYPGDANHTSVTSSTFTLQVNLAGTSTSLAASSNTLVFGQPFTLTATVNSSNAPSVLRTGSVSFYDGLNLLGTIMLDGSSMASLTLTPDNTGKHTFKAIYSGDNDFQVGASSGLSRVVNKDKASITLAPSLTSPIAENQTFNLNIHVALIAPGVSMLTGNLVTIKDNGTVLGTLNLDASGDAALSGLMFSAAGIHRLTAIYAGDADTLAAASSVLSLTII